ncbi:hypothetical protein [Halomonas ventosae]|uniref:hypothetical protein n=1 Tax=Halomonas ventosae TaxID=229007 RepID=UPI00105CEDEB|nr:hypothetical protein [Halomonas ventosae]
MPNYATGIDDIATTRGACSGWTFICIDHSALDAFETAAAALLQEAKLKSFHGKEFKRRKIDSYIKFLKLVRSTLESESGSGFVSSTLLGQDWKTEFEGFCNNVIGGSFSSAGVEPGPISEASQRIASPLFTFQRMAESNCRGGSTIVQIDRHALYDSLDSDELKIEGTKVSGQLPIIAALRAYGKRQFPNAPEIEREGISVCPDEDSFLVQAADIIGNFSTALAFRHLGRKSKSNDLKCSTFHQVFGDLIDFSDFPEGVERNGDELVLAPGSASFTFSIGGAGV